MSPSNIPPRARVRVLIPLAVAVLCAVAADGSASRAQDGQIVGRPRVIDGDTLDFAGHWIDISGIDAPEAEQTCGTGEAVWPCGLEARWALLNRVGRHWVTCVPSDPAARGGLRAACYLAGVGQLDVGAWLVAEGWALADREAGDRYAAEEAAAQAARRGLWRGAFEAPWDWRRGRTP